MVANKSHVPVPDADEIARVKRVMLAIGGSQVDWGAQNTLDILVAEHQLHAQQEASARLTRATWVLAGATVALVLVTIALFIATLRGSN